MAAVMPYATCIGGAMTTARRTVVAILGAAVLGLATTVIMAAPAHAGHRGVSLGKGQQLNRGDWIERGTSDGIVRLIMQTDGNLVRYLLDSNHRWIKTCGATGTVPSGYKAVYQYDGNFVVYPSSGRALWASNTVGDRGQTVDMDARGALWVGYTKLTSGRFAGNCET
jgi:hypothetical protein